MIVFIPKSLDYSAFKKISNPKDTPTVDHPLQLRLPPGTSGPRLPTVLPAGKIGHPLQRWRLESEKGEICGRKERETGRRREGGGRKAIAVDKGGGISDSAARSKTLNHAIVKSRRGPS